MTIAIDPDCKRGCSAGVLTRGGRIEWCDCKAAEDLQAKAPDFVDRWNAHRQNGSPLSAEEAQRRRDELAGLRHARQQKARLGLAEARARLFGSRIDGLCVDPAERGDFS